MVVMESSAVLKGAKWSVPVVVKLSYFFLWLVGVIRWDRSEVSTTPLSRWFELLMLVYICRFSFS